MSGQPLLITSIMLATPSGVYGGEIPQTIEELRRRRPDLARIVDALDAVPLDSRWLRLELAFEDGRGLVLERGPSTPA